jgi:hypothetical protein
MLKVAIFIRRLSLLDPTAMIWSDPSEKAAHLRGGTGILNVLTSALVSTRKTDAQNSTAREIWISKVGRPIIGPLAPEAIVPWSDHHGCP